MARIYDCSYAGLLQNGAITEIILLKNTSTSLIRVRRWSINITVGPLPSTANVATNAYRLGVGYVLGSGGSAGVIIQHDAGDAAPKATVVVGNTTGSTPTLIIANQFMYIYSGPDQILCEPVPVAEGEAFSILCGPSGSATAIGSYIEWEEIGG